MNALLALVFIWLALSVIGAGLCGYAADRLGWDGWGFMAAVLIGGLTSFAIASAFLSVPFFTPT